MPASLETMGSADETFRLAVMRRSTRLPAKVTRRALTRYGVLLFAAVACRSTPGPPPSASPSPHPPTPVAQGPALAEDPVLPHQTFTIESKVLAEPRRIHVYTPPGYDGSAKAYPILYMPDGGLQEDFPHVTADVDALVRAGAIRPMIVVGIENTERRRDMTGPTTVESDRKIAPRVGGSAAFRAFIRDELMPEVGRRFRGDGETAIVGESLAGLFVLETFLEEPGLFDTSIALSPSLWWNDQALVRGAGERLRSRPDGRATLFVASASDDGLEETAGALAAALRADAPASVAWYYEPMPQLLHSTIYRGASRAVFRKLFPPR